ncbi:hypothetical protein Glove_89g75 [Diversispora epigaea]|uniref:Uncharacterized protein n=1 Tax=Diversispora epigaea TaxID=1348612 RepID=A0A397J6D7_9GLOM|nr:hypothetical protein Glove_89g75 [Diversispora epigaea]
MKNEKGVDKNKHSKTLNDGKQEYEQEQNIGIKKKIFNCYGNHSLYFPYLLNHLISPVFHCFELSIV